MKYVYQLNVTELDVNAFDTSIFCRDETDLGLFTNKGKAEQAFIDLVDEMLEGFIDNGEKLELEIYGESKVRIELMGKIVWFEGEINKLKVL